MRHAVILFLIAFPIQSCQYDLSPFGSSKLLDGRGSPTRGVGFAFAETLALRRRNCREQRSHSYNSSGETPLFGASRQDDRISTPILRVCANTGGFGRREIEASILLQEGYGFSIDDLRQSRTHSEYTMPERMRRRLKYLSSPRVSVE